MREGLVGLRHAIHVVLALERSSLLLERIEDLARELVRHVLLATLALRWLVSYARDRREKHMEDKLAGEILDALEQQGNAFKRKDDMYRMAQANKAFAHYRW